MVTQQAKKELTVEQYEFYKTKENPMTDAQIIKLYDLDNNKLYAWKKKHNLIGKNYGLQGTTNLKVYKKSDVEEAPVPAEPKQNETPLLKENKIEQERKKRILEGIEDINSYSANQKVKEKIDSRKTEPVEKAELAVDVVESTISSKTLAAASLDDDFSDFKKQLQKELDDLREANVRLEQQHIEHATEKEELRNQLALARQESGYFELMTKVSDAVKAERFRQNNLYGHQRHPNGDWFMILMEEVGEVAQAMQTEKGWGKGTDADNLYEELIHVAAVASAIAEQIAEERAQ